MNVIIIIFMIVSTIFALASIGYVVADIMNENRNKEAPKKE